MSIALWLGLQWYVRRPDAIVEDFTGWRSADTQTIARNFWRDRIDLAHPRIAWGGDGPGYVEAELQLYPALIAIFANLFGPGEWPGQAISLLSVALAYALLYGELSRRFAPDAALAGCALLLFSRGPTGHSTAVQPDSLAFLFFVLGWLTFLRFWRSSSSSSLVVSSGAGALAALLKPTNLALGVAQFVFLALRDRQRLRDPKIWAMWATVLLLLGLHLWSARDLFIEYGNTFGVLSGGDSKAPKLRHLAMPGVWLGAFKTSVVWGTGIPAALAAIVLALRRKLLSEELALAAATLSLLVVSLRYTSHGEWGNHYVLSAGVLGAWLVAHAYAEVKPFAHRGVVQRAVLVLGVSAIALAQYTHAVYRILTTPIEPEVALGHELSEVMRPGEDLIVVRARSMLYDDFWSTLNNYQDPRIFYLADVRGWVLPNDDPGTDHLLEYWRKGARYYAEPADPFHQYPAVTNYLTAHAELLFDGEVGKIWRLPPR